MSRNFVMLHSCSNNMRIGSISWYGSKSDNFFNLSSRVSLILAAFHPSNILSLPSYVIMWLLSSANHCAWNDLGVVNWSFTSLSSRDLQSSSRWNIWMVYHSLNFWQYFWFIHWQCNPKAGLKQVSHVRSNKSTRDIPLFQQIEVFLAAF